MRSNSHGEPAVGAPQPPLCPPPPHDEEEFEPPRLAAQPFTMVPLAERPGGGPRGFGAPHNSEVTAVGVFRSPSVPLVVGSLFCGLK